MQRLANQAEQLIMHDRFVEAVASVAGPAARISRGPRR